MFLYWETRSDLSDAHAPIDSIVRTIGMFSSSLVLASWVLSLSTVSSSALPSPLDLISTSPNKPAAFGTLAANSRDLQALASPALSYSPECERHYGSDLNRDSCNNALAKISRVTTPMTFGERNTGSWDVILPRRYISGKSFADF